MDEDFSPYTSVDGASIFVSLGKTEEREKEGRIKKVRSRGLF